MKNQSKLYLGMCVCTVRVRVWVCVCVCTHLGDLRQNIPDDVSETLKTI